MTDIRHSLIGTRDRPELVFSRVYRAPLDDVRRAFTSTESLARWFGTVHGEPSGPGDPFRVALSDDPDDLAIGRVVACEPNHLRVTWSWQGEPASTITARFEELDGGHTSVTLLHALNGDDHAVGYGGGWEDTLTALAGALGEDVPSDRTGLEESAVKIWRTLVHSPLDLTRTFDAPVDRVWRAFTSADPMAAWWWNHWDDVRLRIDAHVGGHWSASVDAHGIAVGGTYLVVDEPHRLAFTWEWTDDDGTSIDESVDIRFESAGTGTLLRLRHSGPWADDAPASAYLEGWEFTLDQLAAMLPSDDADEAART